jgi:hypothetical protein
MCLNYSKLKTDLPNNEFFASGAIRSEAILRIVGGAEWKETIITQIDH